MDMLEAECALATFTIKVGVLMFDDTVAVVATYIVFQASAKIFARLGKISLATNSP